MENAQRVALYARQSEDVPHGVQNQLQRCRALTQARNWTVAREYVDNDTSAAKARKEGTAWAEMLEDLRNGAADVVVAVDLDRLLRTTRDLVAISETGAKVLTVDGEIDLTTADGEFRASMLTALAQFEVRRKGERQKRANASRAARGLTPPGRRRYGYESDGATPREEEAALVRRMFDHVATGGSIYSLYTAFIDEGISPAPGKAWRPNRFRYILQNPVYAGFVRHKGVISKSDVVIPIVSEEQAEHVRALLADPSRRTTPGPTVKHLFSGLIFCGVCGNRLFYMRGYRCHETSHAFINKHMIEPYLRDHIATAFVTGGDSLFPEGPEPSRIVDLVKRHKKNAEAVAATIEDRDEGLIPAPMARARLIELRTAREEIEAALDAAKSAKSSAGAVLELAQELIVHDVVPMDEFDAMKARVLEKFDALDLDRQREIVKALIHVEVDKGRDTRKRVRVEHLLATHLNEDVNNDEIYYTD